MFRIPFPVVISVIPSNVADRNVQGPDILKKDKIRPFRALLIVFTG